MAMICCAIYVRVRPSNLLVFETYVDGDGRSAPNSRGSFFSNFRRSWSDSSSVFSWADKGRWMTADVPDVQARRAGDRFRIGFEPTFVDFTISGVWFVVLFFVLVRIVPWLWMGGGGRRRGRGGMQWELVTCALFLFFGFSKTLPPSLSL